MEKTELLRILKEDVSRFNRLRRENPSLLPDLNGSDLAGANLVQADLGRANLAEAILRGANLQGANLGGAILEKADLRGADLTEASLHRTRLQGADLRGARIGGFEGEGRLCMNVSTFRGVRWDREQIEEMLRAMNQNDRWTIRYEIIPKG